MSEKLTKVLKDLATLAMVLSVVAEAGQKVVSLCSKD